MREPLRTHLKSGAPHAHDEQYWRGVDDERAQIARELHDTLFCRLHAAILRLQNASECLAAGSTDGACEDLRVARTALEEAAREMRGWLGGQAPEWTATETLAGAVRRLAAEVQRTHTACCVQFTFGADVPVVPAPLRWELARIAQEALLNAARHGGARLVELCLEHLAADRLVRLCVRDDGCGFDPPAVSDGAVGRGFGLRAMDARARRLGGTLTIDSRRGAGTTVAAIFPTDFLLPTDFLQANPARTGPAARGNPSLDH